MKHLFCLFLTGFFWVWSSPGSFAENDANNSVPVDRAPSASAPSLLPSPIPDALKPWESWVRWENGLLSVPPAFNNTETRTPVWPGSLKLSAGAKGGSFELAVKVFTPAWLELPGGADAWPQAVRIDARPAAVVEHQGRPAIFLSPGAFVVRGEFPWAEMPQRLSLPSGIGVLDLTLNGQKVEIPNWDEKGFLWLKRARSEETEREYLQVQMYRVLEDGIPLWLRTEIELSVAGKSREESFGNALPSGWRAAAVDSPLPCAVDDQGRLKVQVRAGKWTIRIDAFRLTPAETIGFEKDAQPLAPEELIGFQAKPDFRVLELADIEAIDVSQTTFPDHWRQLPVYRWVTEKPIRLVEKMRGMGFQKPEGLNVSREFWLDEGGKLMTFRDQIRGTAQQSWRLDVSPGQKLGAVKMAGEGQLVTRNPVTGASGIEVRQRDLHLEAVGQVNEPQQFSASGWQAEVSGCDATLHLPPGWRVLALLGAEWVEGDWVTAWTLLDLFLLLILAMAVGRMWGPLPALVAVLGFGLSYHEADAPRYLWFFLLVPIALLRVVPTGWARKVLHVWKFLAIAVLVVNLVPFVGQQLQSFLFPQLEINRARLFEPNLLAAGEVLASAKLDAIASPAPEYSNSMQMQRKEAPQRQQLRNMLYDTKARIQTGPAVPTWSWREVKFGWRGPVVPGEQVKLLLIPPLLERAITLFRVFMLLLLVAVVLESKRWLPSFLQRPPKLSPRLPALVAVGLLLLGLGASLPEAKAESFPPAELLNELKSRLVRVPDAFPHAAEIPSVKLQLNRRTLLMEAEIHVAATAAVPLPGRLPTWSPVRVLVDGKPASAVGRAEGYLWVVLEAGVHQVRVEGVLPNVSDWEWTFLLPPRSVSIDAPGWIVSGVKPNGVPEAQVFFAVKSPALTTEAAYDRKDFAPAIEVERSIEIGLLWQVTTTVRRLTASGKAVALSIPLLPGERVLSSKFTVTNGAVEARLGTGESEISWQSELDQTPDLALLARENERWVESWHLVVSPVWNLSFTGLAPVYEVGGEELAPVWRPWPGERVDLRLTRPEAIPGATMTVRSVEHSTSLGARQRTAKLQLNLQASLGQDMSLELDPTAEITSLKIQSGSDSDYLSQPVRRDGSKVIIPVRPGEQRILLEWRTLAHLGWVT